MKVINRYSLKPIKDDLSFLFSLEDSICSEFFFNHTFNFYQINKLNEDILVGRCVKDNLWKNQKFNLEDYTIEDNFWNSNEIDDMKSFIRKNQISRLQEWILTRTLIKYGFKVFYNENFTRLHLNFSDITILKNKHNKPYIKIDNAEKISTLNISISHTKNYIFVAICSKPIGIDNEIIKNHSIYWEKKYFSKNEFEYITRFLNKYNSFSKNIITTLMWSFKEATLKLKGNQSLAEIKDIIIEVDGNDIITRFLSKNITAQNFFNIKEESIVSFSLLR